MVVGKRAGLRPPGKKGAELAGRNPGKTSYRPWPPPCRVRFLFALFIPTDFPPTLSSSLSFPISLPPALSSSLFLVFHPKYSLSLSLSLQPPPPPPPPIRNPPLDNLTVKCARTASPRRGGTRTTTLVVPSRRFTSIHHGLSTFVPTSASLSRSFSYARLLFQAEAYVTRSCRINSSLDVWRNGMHVAGI